MSTVLAHFALPFDFSRLQQFIVAGGALGRLLLSCLLGGAIGLQRELKHRAAGVRTNLLICLGAAFFTLLSSVLAGEATTDKSRVASNIVQGVGFLGAGLILQNRNRISGLTSAASVWVVASIGMACGAGLYAAGAIATAIVILALELVGFIERRGNVKGYPLIYEVRGSDQTLMLSSVLGAMDKVGQRLSNVERDAIGELQRVSFVLTATSKKHQQLCEQLSAEPAIGVLRTFRDPEED